MQKGKELRAEDEENDDEEEHNFYPELEKTIPT